MGPAYKSLLLLLATLVATPAYARSDVGGLRVGLENRVWGSFSASAPAPGDLPLQVPETLQATGLASTTIASGSGLFLQPDPEGFADSVNPYAGFAWDPVNLRDPTGREVFLEGGGHKELLAELESLTGLRLWTCGNGDQKKHNCKIGQLMSGLSGLYPTANGLNDDMAFARNLLLDAMSDKDPIVVMNSKKDPLSTKQTPKGERGVWLAKSHPFVRPKNDVVDIGDQTLFDFVKGLVVLDPDDFKPDVLTGNALSSQTLGLTFIHELLYFVIPFGEDKVLDDPACPPPRPGETGAVVDWTNQARAGAGVPARTRYCPQGIRRDGRDYWMMIYDGGRINFVDVEKAKKY